jgi:hypothetical protein
MRPFSKRTLVPDAWAVAQSGSVPRRLPVPSSGVPEGEDVGARVFELGGSAQDAVPKRGAGSTGPCGRPSVAEWTCVFGQHALWHLTDVGTPAAGFTRPPQAQRVGSFKESDGWRSYPLIRRMTLFAVLALLRAACRRSDACSRQRAVQQAAVLATSSTSSSARVTEARVDRVRRVRPRGDGRPGCRGPIWSNPG